MKVRVLMTLLLVSCVAALPATASTFVNMSSQELVAQADALIEGRVINLSSFWTDSGRLIATEAVVAVDEVLFGDAPAKVTVRTFGGQVGDIRVDAPGFPRFESGERVLLYLKADSEDGTLRVLGYQQGQFRVVTRRDGVTLAVPMVDDDARFLTRDGRLAPAARSTEIGAYKASILKVAERTGRIER